MKTNRSNLVCIVLMSFLIVFAVSLCVFYNLNALATTDIAYAEEPVRGVVSSTGLARSNYISYNWGDFWEFNNTATGTETVIYSSTDLTISIYGSGTIIGNTISLNSSTAFNIVFNFITGASKDRVALQYASAFGYTLNTGMFSVLDQRMINGSYNSTTMSSGTNYYYSVRAVNNKYLDNNSFIRWSFTASSTPCVFDLDWVYFNNETTFSGYVSPSYEYYGYNQGYADGVASVGGSGETSYADLSSTGVVRDNLVNNNDGSTWNYNVSLAAPETRIGATRDVSIYDDLQSALVFTGSPFNCFLKSSGSSSISGNTIHSGSGSSFLWFQCTTGNPIIHADIYTFTFGLSNVLGSGTGTVLEFYCGTYTSDLGYITIVQADELLNSTTYDSSYVSYTLDLSRNDELEPYLHGFWFAIWCRAGSSRSYDLDWVKVENGDSFSGYVPKSYSMLGYEDGYRFGYREGQTDTYSSFNTDNNLTYKILDTNYNSGSVSSWTQDPEDIYYDAFGYVFNDGNSSLYCSYNRYNVGFSGQSNILPYFYIDLGTYVPYGSTITFKTNRSMPFVDLDSSSETFGETHYTDPFLLHWVNGGLYPSWCKMGLFDYDGFTNGTYLDIWSALNDNSSDYNQVLVSSNTGTGYDNSGYFDFGGNTLSITVNFPTRYVVLAFFSDMGSASSISMDLISYNKIFKYEGIDYINQIPSAYQGYTSVAFNYADYDKGWNDGYDVGKSDGFVDGYHYAGENFNDYSLLGLFSAVVESPVKVISEALDFELLGYNLKNFLFALLSLALVLFVIKLFV